MPEQGMGLQIKTELIFLNPKDCKQNLYHPTLDLN